MAEPKTGPLTREELEAVWKSVTDSEYSRAFIERGEGQGFEAHTQAMVQFARVSRGIDRSTQAIYVRPWSGQTNEPAAGGFPSTVTLQLARTTSFAKTIVLSAGTIVEELATDFGPNGGEEFATGRRYLFSENAGFTTGDVGPFDIIAVADRLGEGFDNPLPGTIKRIVQVGVGLTNSRATVILGTNTHSLVMQTEPDVITHAQIGQYVEFVAGSNQGQIRRIVGIVPPDPDMPVDGGTALLEATQLFRFSVVAGEFIPGEIIEQPVTGATSMVVLQGPTHLVTQRQSGDITTGLLVYGTQSGATAIFDSVDQAADLIPEAITASWRIVGWDELGITVTNEASPTGGRSAVLDEIGYEREIYRGTGEGDVGYRERVADFADLISPKALTRIANRILVPHGYEAHLCEVGYPTFRGFFYDGDPTQQNPAIAFAYDLDFALQPGQKLMLQLDYTEFRAFFLLGVPLLGLGEFGFAYDVGMINFYDAAPYLSFFDGYPATAATVYRTLWQAINEAKAGGVGFDLSPDC
jgi:hypothetical protein